MTFSSRDLLDTFSDLILADHGSPRDFDHTADPSAANDRSLTFVANIAQLPDNAAVVVVDQNTADAVAEHASHLIVVKDVRLALAKMKQRYDDGLNHNIGWPDVHESAVIHQSAKLADNVKVGPNAVIGANALIEENVVIQAGAIIEHDVKIGAGSIIHSTAVIGYSCELGKGVIVKSASVIGGEGFGFAQDSDSAYHRIPHTGIVVLEDEVRVGSGSFVDRATFGETRIGKGVKIDNMVHIAHNCEVGEHSILIAGVGMAGSSKFGKRVICSGQAAILDHRSVADDVVLVHRAGVIEDIEEAGTYGGTPAIPFRAHVQRMNLGKRVAKLETKLKALLNKTSS